MWTKTTAELCFALNKAKYLFDRASDAAQHSINTKKKSVIAFFHKLTLILKSQKWKEVSFDNIKQINTNQRLSLPIKWRAAEQKNCCREYTIS